MKTSLIISTYNWVKALELVLDSVAKQSELPNEVLIADDGSTAETAELVRNFQEKLPIPLIHVWHEDKGFRLSEIRNKTIKKSKYEYIIQIDGDVILHKNFIANHKQFAEKNCFITGSRVFLNPKITNDLLLNENVNLGICTRDLKNRFNALYFPFFNFLFKPKNSPIEKMAIRIRGCNMSFWKKDLLAINGYNEDFVGWGIEDSDIVIRLLKKGCYRKKIKLAAIQYHLYHKESSKENLEINHQLMKQALKSNNYRAKNGIEKLLLHKPNRF